MADAVPPEDGLRRALSLPLLTLYGLGTTIGAGIFVLTGKVAGEAGVYAPLSFLLASLLAGISALCFAEMVSRFPESGGEAVYIKEGLGSDRLALLTGALVILASMVSTSAIIIGFSGYFGDLFDVSPAISRIGVVLLLGLIAWWGIRESVTVAALVTVAEIGVLVAIAIVGTPQLDLPSIGDAIAARPLDGGVWAGVLSGGVLAFYAFIGFEDIVNVAEETRDAERTVPRAIVLTLIVTTVLYAMVSVIAVTLTPVEDLAESPAPLSFLFERISGLPGETISVIAVFSVLNGALIQIIMASRVFFGLARRGWLPAWLSRVDTRTHTPACAIAVCVATVAVLATLFPVDALARATSFVTLTIFALVSFALIRIKRTRGPVAAGRFSVPFWLPVLSVAAIALLFAAEAIRRLSS